jgi:hypothetical protein
MLHQTRAVRQGLERFLSLSFVALVLLTALLVTILLVALVVGSTVGPQLAHAAASHVQFPSFGIRPYPTDPCPGGTPSC